MAEPRRSNAGKQLSAVLPRALARPTWDELVNGSEQVSTTHERRNGIASNKMHGALIGQLPMSLRRLSGNYPQAFEHVYDYSERYQAEHNGSRSNPLYNAFKTRFPRRLLLQSENTKKTIKYNPSVRLDSTTATHTLSSGYIEEIKNLPTSTTHYFGGQRLCSQPTSDQIANQLLGQRRLLRSVSYSSPNLSGDKPISPLTVKFADDSTLKTTSIPDHVHNFAHLSNSNISSHSKSLLWFLDDKGAVPQQHQVQQQSQSTMPVHQFLFEKYSMRPSWHHFPSTDDLLEPKGLLPTLSTRVNLSSIGGSRSQTSASQNDKSSLLRSSLHKSNTQLSVSHGQYAHSVVFAPGKTLGDTTVPNEASYVHQSAVTMVTVMRKEIAAIIADRAKLDLSPTHI